MQRQRIFATTELARATGDDDAVDSPVPAVAWSNTAERGERADPRAKTPLSSQKAGGGDRPVGIGAGWPLRRMATATSPIWRTKRR